MCSCPWGGRTQHVLWNPRFLWQPLVDHRGEPWRHYYIDVFTAPCEPRPFIMMTFLSLVNPEENGPVTYRRIWVAEVVSPFGKISEHQMNPLSFIQNSCICVILWASFFFLYLVTRPLAGNGHLGYYKYSLQNMQLLYSIKSWDCDVLNFYFSMIKTILPWRRFAWDDTY